MVQLMPTKVMPTLLLSFHFCLTREHAMPQVHSRFRDMAAKHRDGRDKRPRHEVSACPSCHACIYHLYTLQAFFHYASAWLLSPDQGPGSVTGDGPRPPRAHPCHSIVPCVNMQHMTVRCTGIGLREVHGHRFVTASRPRGPQGPFARP